MRLAMAGGRGPGLVPLGLGVGSLAAGAALAAWIDQSPVQVGRAGWGRLARGMGMVAGTALMSWALRRRRLGALTVAALGAALALADAARIAGAAGLVPARWRRLELDRKLVFSAPREQVFARLRRFEELPRLFDPIRAVTPCGDNRWRWSVVDPAGRTLSWEAEITRLIPDELIAWRSVGQMGPRGRGSIQFGAAPGGTRVRIRLRAQAARRA